ncbi:MAG TPA: DUF6754 domain-containing protein [Armatimonadota bacterium]|nr:DUF6754 domain-containing protein [Armatimonadota bacterium]
MLLLAAGAWAAVPGAPTNVVAVDDPDEPAGEQLIVSWTAPLPQQWPPGMLLAGYRVFTAVRGRSGQPHAGPVVPLPEPEEPLQTAVGELKPPPWPPYDVQVAGIYLPEGMELQTNEQGEIANPDPVLIYSDPFGPVQPVGIWYDPKLTNVLVMMLIFSTIVIATIVWVGRRAAEVYIRPIAALEAVDDAIGRATEMGKPIVYVSGLSGIGSISTIASMLILGHLSRRTAHYETDIIVPCNDPLVMAAERDIMRQAYLAAGKPDAYKPQNIYFLTDSQFAYVAAVDGIMLREKPAAAFYMGYFYAEALILAETGNQSGAIQIAGTDADTQLPFFITACDYTLMGEELYAASAYLSRQPLLVAQLRGQDIGKTLTAALVAAGTAAATWAAFGGAIAAKFVEWFAR